MIRRETERGGGMMGNGGLSSSWPETGHKASQLLWLVTLAVLSSLRSLLDVLEQGS